jgi:pSer/pThr/pTyr-binding forkhead associated (FHA) protein
VTVCSFCGRQNEPDAVYCIDCGKPLAKSTLPHPVTSGAAVAGGAGSHAASGHIPGTRVQSSTESASITCPFCAGTVAASLPYCPHCGRRLSAPGSGPACGRCASPITPGTRFCATCGAQVAEAGLIRPSSMPERRSEAFALVQLDDVGTPINRFERKSLHTTIGRHDGDLRFPDDPFLSPLHAKISWEQQRLVVRDLGSRNGTWVFLPEPYRMVDGDLLLIGSQIFRFRRLGYPGPHTPDVDATKRMGSMIPSADIATLTQLRSDGSARDVIHLSPGRDVRIGRERGDWMFAYDQSMSAEHAVIRSEDADFVVRDAGSRNGVAIAARGDMVLLHESKILVGDKLLRVELP